MDAVQRADLLYGNVWPLLEAKFWPTPDPPSAKWTKLNTSDTTQFNIQSKINFNKTKYDCSIKTSLTQNSNYLVESDSKNVKG